MEASPTLPWSLELCGACWWLGPLWDGGWSAGAKTSISGEMQLSSVPLDALRHQLYKGRAAREPRFSNDYFIANAVKSNWQPPWLNVEHRQVPAATAERGKAPREITVSERITASDCCRGMSVGLNSLSNISWCLLFLFSFFLSFFSLSGSSLSSLSWDRECIFFGRRGSRANLKEMVL